LSKESSERNSNSDREEIIFMEVENNIDEDKGIYMMDLEEEENYKINGEVNLEEELMCSLS
jgi:hypothetical protein